GLIVLAGSTRPLGPVMVEQLEYIFGLAGGPSPEQRKTIDDAKKAWARVVQIQKGAKYDSKETLLGAPPSYWLDLQRYAAPAVPKPLPQPIYVAQGGRDYQVTAKAFARWKSALAGNKSATLKLSPRLNHALAPGEGKSSPAEYEKPAHVDEELVRDLAA